MVENNISDPDCLLRIHRYPDNGFAVVVEVVNCGSTLL
jgi:hypothetical protein